MRRRSSKASTSKRITRRSTAITFAVVRTIAKVIAVERRLIRYEVESFEGERRIGEGRHARGLVNLESFNRRLAATKT